MTELSTEDARKIKRASNRAAMLTALGAVIIFGSLAYSAVQLRKLDSRIVSKRGEMAKLESDFSELIAEKERLKSEIAALEEFSTVMSKQNTLTRRLAEETLTVAKEVGPAKVTESIDAIIRKAPIEAVVQASATANPVPDRADLFDFRLRLVVPDDRIDEIERASYLFEHPTFTRKLMESDNAANGFEVGYQGWGALNRVRVTLHLQNDKMAELAFDMLEAVNESRAQRPLDKPTEAENRPIRRPIGKGAVTKRAPKKGAPTKGAPTKKAPATTKGAPTKKAPATTKEAPTKGAPATTKEAPSTPTP